MSTARKTVAKKTTPDKTHTLLDDVKAKASGALGNYEERVRQSPEKAVLIALAAGYAAHFLPVGGLLGAPIRLAAFLAKPALFALGAVKACEILQEKVRE